MRRLFFLAGLLLLLLAPLSGRPVSVVEAHALLAKADPPPNSQVREPPTQLDLYFTESLEKKFTRARVLDQTNTAVQDRIEFDPADDTHMRIYLKPVKPGFLTVFWENVSAVDGHRISGSYPLTILNENGSVPAGSPPTGGAQTDGAQAKPSRVAVKALLLIAGAMLTGAFAFAFVVDPALKSAADERTRRALWRRTAISVGAALVGLVVFGVIELVLQASDLETNVSTVLDTRWGGSWLTGNLALLLPLLAMVLLLASSLSRRALAVVGLIGSLAFLALVTSVSHAAAGGGVFWSTLADFVHLVAASVWIGMLAQVVLLFIWAGKNLERDERYAVLSSALRRFSAVASVSVALLLFTGTVSAVIEVGRLSDMLKTSYGLALTAKLLLLVPLLGVGALNAYILRPDLEEAEASKSLRNRPAVLADLEGQLSRIVRYEFGLAIAILIVVGLLSQSTPTRGRVDTSGTGGKFTATQETGDIGATLVIDPNEPGQNTFEVYLTGAVETVESVRLDFQPKGKPSQEARLILDASNPPTFYVGQGAYLSQPGKWEVAVDMRRTRGEDLRLPFNLKVNGTAATATTSAGDFSSPITFSPWTLFLLVGAGAMAVVVVVGGAPRPGRPGGYLGEVIGIVGERVSLTRLRPAWSLAVLVFIGVAMGLVLGSHIDKPLSKDQAAKGNPVKTSPESVARGAVLFSQNCVICHGESGRGDGPQAAALRIPPANLYDHVPYHPDQFFFGVITNGLGGVMPSFKASIGENDRWNILNYLRDRFGEAPVAQ